MTRQRMGVIVFVTGAVLIAAAVILGKFIQPDIVKLGLRRYEAMRGNWGALKFLLFAVGVPVGAGAAVAGAALFGNASDRRVALFALLAAAGAFAAMVVPALFGAARSPTFFGIGGVLIAALALATVWFWGHYRARQTEASRDAADMQAAGYLCFAVAAWNLCGVGGMPGFALYPQKMLKFGVAFATGQLKTVMALLILGWAFTALSFWRASR